MGFLKGLGTAICCIVLFVVLSVFIIAFVLNSTVLSADFVNKQIDKVDMSSIADEIIEEQINQEIPAEADFFKDVASNVIAAQEPLVKAQLHTAVSDAYQYFLEKERDFAITISFIEMKEGLKDSLWEMMVEYLQQQLAGLPDAEIDRYINDVISQIPEESMPAELAILPEAERREAINQYVRDLAGLETGSLSFMVNFVVGDQVRLYLEQYFDDILQEIPDSYTIDESSLDTETLSALEDAKRYIGYFRTAYMWTAIALVVVAGLIFLINWSNIKASVLALGITLLVFSVLNLAGVLVARSFSLRDFADVPASLQSVVEGVYHDVTGIALTFSILVLVIGAILLAASFFIKRRQAAA